jgi:glucoamylase
MDKGIEKHDATRPAKPIKASGHPGSKPTWTSGAKTMVGTAASARSRIWYTVGLGTLNEIYFPDVDQANTRSVRFLVSDGTSFFSDEAWDAEHAVTWAADGVPGCRIESRSKAGRYTIVKEIVTDPVRDTLIVRVHFTPDPGSPELKLYLFVDPQVGDRGAGNDGWCGQYQGQAMLFAQRQQTAMAVAFSPPALRTSAGYSAVSDGRTLLAQFAPLPEANLATKGNVALTAEVNYKEANGAFLIAIACGSDPAEAGQQARAGILEVFDKTQALFTQHWQAQQAQFADIADLSDHPLDMYRVSTAVLETHQSKRFPGAFVASLSLPWGFARSDKDIGGYHVLWPRDMVETAMGKLASGDARAARSTLFYLACTQKGDGGWSQNMWLDGTEHWGAIQMDGMALPILLADKLRQENALDGYDPSAMVHAATRFLLRHGPVSQQGRWEATPGYSIYTVATEVAALLAAADMSEAQADEAGAAFLRQTADAWNDSIDELLYVSGTPLAKEHGVSGYYLRVTPPRVIEEKEIGHLRIEMPNLPFGSRHQKAIDIVSPDALALVRFGLRAANDPRILSTVKLIDATLKRETKTGPVWVRSTKDGYGEKADGSPFLKTGIGRGWPLLAGERAHYEIAAGNREFALQLLRTMARQTSECGMIPEQIWDAEDLPGRMLFNGHPSGSGMPLVWAHGEYIKLLRSLHGGAIWDLPTQTVARYVNAHHEADFQIWTSKQRRGWLDLGKDLRIDLDHAAQIRWNSAGRSGTVLTGDSGFGTHTATLPCAEFPAGSSIHVGVEPAAGGIEDAKPDSFIIHVRVRDQQ